MHLSSAQKLFIRRRLRRAESDDPAAAAGELNIIPFLDIVVNLIMFLLVTIVSVLALSQVEVDLPRHGPPCRGAHCQSSLDLGVTLTDRGIWVSGTGGVLANGCGVESGTGAPTLPIRDGAYDYEALTNCLRHVKGEFPEEDTVIVSADPNIHYEEVLRAMDASRADARGPLFPRVLVAASVR
jgi:biopolymer transport protein TolR